MLGDGGGIVKAEHFKAHGGTASSRDEAAEHFGLQQMMVGVVVPLAEEDEASGRHARGERRRLDEPRGHDVPDLAGEGMIDAGRRLPRRRQRRLREGRGRDEQGDDRQPGRGTVGRGLHGSRQDVTNPR